MQVTKLLIIIVLYQKHRSLRANRTLKQLHLSYCEITSEAGPAIAEMLSFVDSGLEVLNLQGNRIGATGLEAISFGLGASRSLTTFNLSDNKIESVCQIKYYPR